MLAHAYTLSLYLYIKSERCLLCSTMQSVEPFTNGLVEPFENYAGFFGNMQY